MEKFQKLIINTYIIVNLLYLLPLILLFPSSVVNIFKLKEDIVFNNAFIVLYVVSFVILAVLIFTERHKDHINIIIFLILTLLLLIIYYCMSVFGRYLAQLYGVYQAIHIFTDFFFNDGYKSVALRNEFFGTLSMDIKNFFPSIRDELILQILLISDIVGSSMLIYREVEFYRERKK
jgi:hypothetical protein